MIDNQEHEAYDFICASTIVVDVYITAKKYIYSHAMKIMFMIIFAFVFIVIKYESIEQMERDEEENEDMLPT